MNEISTTQKELFRASERNEAANTQMQERSVSAWEGIANLPKKTISNVQDGQVSFTSIFTDEDSITRCYGSTGPEGSWMKCKTEDIQTAPDKPKPVKPTSHEQKPGRDSGQTAEFEAISGRPR